MHFLNSIINFSGQPTSNNSFYGTLYLQIIERKYISPETTPLPGVHAVTQSNWCIVGGMNVTRNVPSRDMENVVSKGRWSLNRVVSESRNYWTYLAFQNLCVLGDIIQLNINTLLIPTFPILNKLLTQPPRYCQN